MKLKTGFKRAASIVVAAAAVFTTAFALLPTASISAADNGVMREGMTAFDYSKEMGLGINLGNTMEAYWLDNNKQYTGAQTIGANTPQNYETCWGAVKTTQEVIDGMKAAGFSTVRIPVYWGNMMENDGNFIINPDYLARVKEIVDYCRNAGVYAVINCHHYDEFLIRRFSLEECEQIFTTLWTQIANYFKNYSDYLVFEGFNEYLGGGPIDSNGNVTNRPDSEAYLWTNTLNQAFVNAVRATGGNNANRILIASGYWTNIDKTTSSQFIMPTDTVADRLMVSVHYVDNSMYWSKKIGGEAWRSYSINQCELLKSAFTDKGIPVFVGETTSNYPSSNFAKNADVTKSSDALDYMLRLITGYGFTPVLWDTNDGFYSRTNYKIKSADNETVIKTLSDELKAQLPTAATTEEITTSEPTTVTEPTTAFEPTTSDEPTTAFEPTTSAEPTTDASPDSTTDATEPTTSVSSATTSATATTKPSAMTSAAATTNAATTAKTGSDKAVNTGAANAFGVSVFMAAAAIGFTALKKRKK